MALKKSQLYNSLWQSCDQLRGGMDASQYKDYILTLLFVKYVSDKKDILIDVPEGGSFADMVKLKGKKEIGEEINKIISKLAEANDLKGVIDQADFDDENKLGRGQEKQDRLSKLIGIFESVDLRANRADGDDLLGDAYEYLMRHFATESGKSKGQFYTPAEVSQVMAKLIGIGPDTKPDQTIYDMTCGSGSLLIKAADEAPNGLSIYGQEMDIETWALARMNMFLHGYETHELWRGNTLAAPHFKDDDGSIMTFDFAVANPPFSVKAWTTGVKTTTDEFKRFEYGVPPEKNGDFAFLLHMIKSLNSKGKGAIILPHGVLFRGNKESDIRRKLVDQGLIKGIIGLPANLFYGTGIPACIIVIDKEDARARRGIFMIDASKGFIKDGNKNRLRAQDIHQIVDVFTKQIEVPRYSRMVPVSEIASLANDYNLNIPRYIDSSEPEDLHDLDAHLNGGIPDRDIEALQAYWDVFPSLRKELFQNSGRAGYSLPKVEAQQIKATILNHPEFQAYKEKVKEIFEAWKLAHEPRLKQLNNTSKPKELIQELAEDLLVRFAELPLLNRYDVYQRLMDYWADVMQDDVYLVVADGWSGAAKPRGVIEDEQRKLKESPDLVVGGKKYKLDLLPPSLIIRRYFDQRKIEIEALQSEQDAAAQALEEFIEEQSGEDGLLAEASNDKGKVTKNSVKERLKQLKTEKGQLTFVSDDAEEIEALTTCLALFEAEEAAAKAVKAAQAKLDEDVLKTYGRLVSNEEEIKMLVIDDKWLATLQAAIVERFFKTELNAITSEVQRLTQGLANRLKQLEERYARTLPELEREVEHLSAKVEQHLKTMGLVWS